MIGIQVFIIDPADTSPQGLPDGSILRFKKARNADIVFAVIIDVFGNIRATGKKVEEKYAFASRWDVLGQVGLWAPQPKG